MLALFTALDDLNLTMADVLAELRRRPAGVLQPITAMTAGVAPPLNYRLDRPWWSCRVINDGPDVLEVAVNVFGQFVTVQPAETLPIDMQGTLITDLWIRRSPLAAADTAFRLIGVY